MSSFRTRLVWIGWVIFACFDVLNVKIASAVEIKVGQYTAEVRTLGFEARTFDGESRDLIGLNRNLENSGSTLGADVETLAAAINDLKADVTETEIHVDLSADVLFDFDKSSIKPEADAALRQVVLIIANKRKGNVTITGHTDAKGSADYNQSLSEKRARSVRQWFIANANVPKNVLLTLGLGESQPVAGNTKPDGSDNPEGRKLNRRVGIVIETK